MLSKPQRALLPRCTGTTIFSSPASRFPALTVSSSTSPRWSDRYLHAVVELQPDGSTRLYPDEPWNQRDGKQATAGHTFVCVQSVVIDGGSLWALDAAPLQGPIVVGGPKLVQIDLASNRVTRVIRFGSDVVQPNSYLNDVRFDSINQFACTNNSGLGGIVGMNLATGTARRLLDGHPSVLVQPSVDVVINGKHGCPMSAAMLYGFLYQRKLGRMELHTGLHGAYYWLTTDQELSGFVGACPEAVLGKHIAVTAIDSGIYYPTVQEQLEGWILQGDIAYSPPLASLAKLPNKVHTGCCDTFHEWYLWDNNPTNLGQATNDNMFEKGIHPGLLYRFVNWYGPALHDPKVRDVNDLFWQQMGWANPDSYLADSCDYLAYVTRDAALFAIICQKLRALPPEPDEEA